MGTNGIRETIRVSTEQAPPVYHRVRAIVSLRSLSQRRRLHLKAVPRRRCDEVLRPPTATASVWEADCKVFTSRGARILHIFFSLVVFEFQSSTRTCYAYSFRRVASRYHSAPSHAPRGLLRLHIRAAHILRKRESSSHRVYTDPHHDLKPLHGRYALDAIQTSFPRALRMTCRDRRQEDGEVDVVGGGIAADDRTRKDRGRGGMRRRKSEREVVPESVCPPKMRKTWKADVRDVANSSSTEEASPVSPAVATHSSPQLHDAAANIKRAERVRVGVSIGAQLLHALARPHRDAAAQRH
ncbi:hypothetical protein DFH08DRAFT_977724 [Mycena albidolilacea]|uniref:Uncharacterized protein n=1 Tax=Mycena albidolilacea TaxID=1033008 RepID=A0AAD6Z075_9AGAR|nr:hypothetical protein DFH08DRAFT_977724 [Mycena albidolilacea]